MAPSTETLIITVWEDIQAINIMEQYQLTDYNGIGNGISRAVSAADKDFGEDGWAVIQVHERAGNGRILRIGQIQ